jgi:hypothetical protein
MSRGLLNRAKRLIDAENPGPSPDPRGIPVIFPTAVTHFGPIPALPARGTVVLTSTNGTLSWETAT